MKKKKQEKRFLRLFSKILNKKLYLNSDLISPPPQKKHSWLAVLCLIGLDYFSTLAYLPALGLLTIGMFSPFATIAIVLVTLFGAAPVYFEVAKRSYVGQGSIAMLEKLVSGWFGKLFILAIISFAATDFVITITLSVADASAHIIENPSLTFLFKDQTNWLINLGISLGMLGILGLVFFLGMREAIITGILVSVPFLLLTFVIIFRGLYELFAHPHLFSNLFQNFNYHGSINYQGLNWMFFFIILLTFPRLALGLSGFETGVMTMPYINGEGKRIPEEKSKIEHEQEKIEEAKKLEILGRIKNTKKMLLTGALIMSFCLITSTLITNIFITQDQVKPGGVAANRALSYLGHKFLGNIFGDIYDVSTITILWFAGGSAMAGLLAIIPRYLPRFGMAPRWVASQRPVVLIITIICTAILLVFRADVTSQSGAYATGVLGLILSSAIAVSIVLIKEIFQSKKSKKLHLWFKFYYFLFISFVFLYIFVDNIYLRPDGIIISSLFFICIVIGSAISRLFRASELRINTAGFVDEESEKLFNKLKKLKLNLVPVTLNLIVPKHMLAAANTKESARRPFAYPRIGGKNCKI